MKKILLFISTLIVLLTSCEQEAMDIRGSLMETHDEGLKSEVLVLKDNAINHIITPYTGEQQSLLFSSDLSVDQLPKKGEIIAADTSRNTPYGLLSRVKNVKKNGNNWEIELENVALDEVFNELEIDTVITFTPDNIGEFYDVDGNRLLTTSTKGNNHIMMSKDKDPEKTIEISVSDNRLNVNFNRSLKVFKGAGNLNYGVHCGYKNLSLRISLTKEEKFFASIEPYIGVHGSLAVTTNKQILKDEPIVLYKHKLPILRFVVFGVPVIIHPQFTVYAQGVLNAEAKFNTSFDITGSLYMMMQYRNQWNSKAEFRSNMSDTNLPFNITSAELTGSVKAGLGAELFGGIYAEEMGFGLNALVYAEDKASIKFDSESSNYLMIKNPSINFSTGVDFNCIFKAHIMGFELIDDYVKELPSYVFFSKDLYLFPQFNIFQTRKSDSGYILRYDVDIFNLTTLLNGKYGYALFDENEKLLSTQQASGGTKISNTVIRHENMIENLEKGKKYLISPMSDIFGLQFYGKKIELDTEKKFRFCFRCEEQTYDVLTFDFDFSKSSSNSIDVSYDTTDYTGEPMRMHIVGSYNDMSKTFSGSVDFLFYNDPDQRRVDGFNMDLSSSDTGYVGCTKIVNNDGCYAAIRIYEIGNAEANKYEGVKLKDNGCNVGLYSFDYQQ